MVTVLDLAMALALAMDLAMVLAPGSAAVLAAVVAAAVDVADSLSHQFAIPVRYLSGRILQVGSTNQQPYITRIIANTIHEVIVCISITIYNLCYSEMPGHDNSIMSFLSMSAI